MASNYDVGSPAICTMVSAEVHVRRNALAVPQQFSVAINLTPHFPNQKQSILQYLRTFDAAFLTSATCLTVLRRRFHNGDTISLILV